MITAANNDEEEVDDDAIQLLVIASFNGVCRLIAALSQNGFLSPDQVAGVHDAMTTPLDDPEWRDDSLIAGARDVLEQVLSMALRDVRRL